LLLAFLVQVLRSRNEPREIAAAPRSRAAAEVPAPATRAQPSDAAPDTSSIAGVLASRTDDGRSVEVCGFGKVPMEKSDLFGTGKIVNALAQKAQARWQSALLNSDDSRARAVGLLVEATPDFGRAAGESPSAELARDSLIQLATGTADPAIYAMATALCTRADGGTASDSCAPISAQQWANIDPDNAVPWLMVAGKARAANDAAGAADALGRAAAAHKSDGYNWSLLSYAQPEMPADVTPTEQYLLATRMIGYEAAWSMPQYPLATKLCTPESVADDSERRNCGALAELLVSHGTTLIDLSVGASIGSHVGWPSERLDPLRQERNALMQVLVEPMAPDYSDQWDCNHVRIGNELLKQIARLGELGAAREALERSGATIEELAQRHAEFVEKITAEARRRAQDQDASNASP
jgi:hypothetical protein